MIVDSAVSISKYEGELSPRLVHSRGRSNTYDKFFLFSFFVLVFYLIDLFRCLYCNNLQLFCFALVNFVIDKFVVYIHLFDLVHSVFFYTLLIICFDYY